MMFRKTTLVLLLTASGLVHAQVPISGLPNASVPLGSADQIVVNQKVTSTAYSTRQAPLSALAPFFPSLTSHYILQAADPTLTQSRVLAGTANQVVLTDGGALGNLTLSLPQSICTTCGPTFSSLTLTGVLNGFSGVFSSTLQSAGYTGTTGSFGGTLSSAGYTGTTGVFSSTLQAASLSLTTPLQATSGGTGFGTYAVGDLLAASTTTALSKLSDVAVGSYLRSGGVSTLPLWSTLTLPNAATTGDVLIATGTNAIGSLADVTAGSYLRSNGAGAAPVYSTVKIPNTAVTGDIWYGSAANTISALTGNITTGVQFLAQTGSGAASAAPVWTTLPGSFTGFANPSGLIGLTVVNGVATTATRSDATHAIDQSIVPTWTGLHSFSSGTKSTATGGFGGTVDFLASAVIPSTGWQTPGNALDQKNVQCYYNGAGLLFNCSFANDTGSAEKLWLSVSRGTTTTVSGITLGNSTDSPTVTVPGGIIVGGARPVPVATSSSIIIGASTGGVAQQWWINGAGAVDNRMWDIDANTTNLVARVVNDANSSATSWLQVTRSGISISDVSLSTNSTMHLTGIGTTASAANVFIDNASGNSLLRSTSSRRYKTDITTLADATDVIMSLRPVRFHSKATADSPTAWFYGLVAEEVAAVEPSLVVKDPEGRPDGVQYDRVQVFMLPVVQSMHRQIHWLWACIFLLASWNVYLTLRKK